MKIEQRKWSEARGWNAPFSGTLAAAQLAFVFGSRARLAQSGLLDAVREAYPDATVFGCSTAGEIAGTTVQDETLVCTAVQFAHSQLRLAVARLDEAGRSEEAGVALARALPARVQGSVAGESVRLAHVLVLSDGLTVNGSKLVEGLASALPRDVTFTGGLAGDGSSFERTLVAAGRVCESGLVAAIGLYGDRLKVTFGSLGGWDPFGPERIVTRSVGNVLHELDGQSALGLYKTYLGEHSRDLPASGLLFPLSVRDPDGGAAVVRTILGVDERRQTMTFAGDIPEGSYARLMKANSERLIDGAVEAARTCRTSLESGSAELALLISCVGRKLVLRQRVEDEVEGVEEILGRRCALLGFYSYGEISPFTPGARCELHNQTMTITTLSEG